MPASAKALKRCRISGSTNLNTVLRLGEQAMTGIFPEHPEQPITVGPLELVWCPDSGLLQLGHSYNLSEMYGMNYGYRSGLNASMVKHLQDKVSHLLSIRPVTASDIVLDIGSNDATLLSSYEVSGLKRIGIDPTGVKFASYYKDGIELVPDFFSAKAFKSMFPGEKAKIVSSISMFYDLEAPLSFVADVAEILDKDGIWHFEQSYMPTMLKMNSYDTACHEHLEYYSLRVVKNMLESQGLKIVDVQLNDINGGSFAVTATHENSSLVPNSEAINELLQSEEDLELDTIKPYQAFEKRVIDHRQALVDLIRGLRADGKRVAGYGASTKGNVLLQYCGFTENDISCIAEVNQDKFGCYTPGTHIPIMSEAEVMKTQPDYMLVLPWHFKNSILKREKAYLDSGGKLIFPMPEIEIV